MKVTYFKMPWKTKFFNKNQKVFVVLMTGNQACQVSGKFRGKGRRIWAWFKWNDKCMHLLHFKEMEMSETDYKNIMGKN